MSDWDQIQEAERLGIIPSAERREHWDAEDYQIMADALDDAGLEGAASAFRVYGKFTLS